MELHERIIKFLNKYALHNQNYDPEIDDENEKYSSPDASELKYCAEMLKKGQKPYRCWSEWSSGGYHPYSSKEGRNEHDELVSEIYNIINNGR